MNSGQWQTALMDIDRATEFTGDDVDQYTKLVDLGDDFANVLVKFPAITSSTVGIVIQESQWITEVPSPVYILDDDATGSFLHATTAATTALSVVFHVGAARFIRIKCGSNQAADVEFRVKGC